jgi:hypothetical protein
VRQQRRTKAGPAKLQLASNYYSAAYTLAGVHLPTDAHISLAGSLLATAGTSLSALKFEEKGAYKQTPVHISELWKGCIFWAGLVIVPPRPGVGVFMGSRLLQPFGSTKARHLPFLVGG